VGEGAVVGVAVAGWVGGGDVAVGSGVAVGARGVGVGCWVVGVSLAGGEGAGVAASGVPEVRRQASSDKPISRKIERQASFWIFMLIFLV